MYVNDLDAPCDQATAAGPKLPRPVADQAYGARAGVLEDQFGHSWSVATHIEGVSAEEILKRAASENNICDL